jgi:hypothetical protein
MKSRTVVFLLLAAAPMLMMVSCKKESANSSNVKFKLTDAPGAYDQVNIDIRGIEVYSQGQGWVTFNSNLGVVNILDYTNGQTTLLAEGQLNAGTITAAHLIIGDNNSVVIDGISHHLESSAALQAGLSVNLNNQLQAGQSYEWTIDFDAAQSIAANTSGSYTLSPTLHVVVDGSSTVNMSGTGSTSGGVNIGGIIVGGGSSTVVNGSTAGSISGSIATTIGLSMVYATDASGHVTSTMTNLAGGFTLSAVQSGSYNISIDPVLPLLSTHTISNVQVTAGQTTNLGLVSM